MSFIILILSYTYIILSISSILTNTVKYKFYRKTYLALKNNEYTVIENSPSYIKFRRNDKLESKTYLYHYINDDIYINNKDIKLIEGHLLYSLLTFMDPYSWYYYNRIRKQIKLKSLSKEDLRDYKLKNLGI